MDKTWVFAVGDLADDFISVAASVKATSLEEAQAKLSAVVEDIQQPGGVEGVFTVSDGNGVQLWARITPSAITDDDNWEEED